MGWVGYWVAYGLRVGLTDWLGRVGGWHSVFIKSRKLNGFCFAWGGG